MRSVAEDFQEFMKKKLYVANKPCPNCGGEMYAWRFETDGKPRHAPVCPTCGYKELTKQETTKTAKIVENSRIKQCLSYLQHKSIYGNETVKNYIFEDFRADNEKMQGIKSAMQKSAEEFASGSNKHIYLFGSTGVGKTHLSMSVLNEVVRTSQYTKFCMFVNYAKLYSDMKDIFSNDEAFRKVMRNTVEEIKRADLIVLDDVGAELGKFDERTTATTYNNDLLNSIVEAREHAAMIVTSNLNGAQLQQAYGSRIVSRILNNSQNMNMYGLKDQRLPHKT